LYFNFNPNFSVEKFALGDEYPDPYGQDVMVNTDLQIVLQFVASAAVADFAFQLQNPGLKQVIAILKIRELFVNLYETLILIGRILFKNVLI
jgi:hypothetical protein